MFKSDEGQIEAAAANAPEPVPLMREVAITPAAGLGTRPSSAPLIDPLYLFASIWNSKKLVLAATLLGIALAVLYALSVPKTYVATAQILIDPRDLKVVQNEVTPNGLPGEATLALIESQAAVIRSNRVLLRVVERARLMEDPEFNGSKKGLLAAFLPEWLSFFEVESDEVGVNQELITVAKLRDRLSVERGEKSFVVDLSVSTTDPQKSARLANLFAEVFIDEQGRVQSETARRATGELSSRLSELREEVVRTEQAVEAYKADKQLIGVGGRLVDDEYLLRVNTQLANARAEITALTVRANSMKNASVEDVVAGTLPEELTSDALVRLRSIYSDLAQDAASLGTKLGPRHPQRIAIEQALASSRRAVENEMSRIVAAAQTELARAQRTERELTAQIDALKDKQVATGGAFVKLRQLEREAETARAVYEAYLLRARETGEQESLNTANVRVISEATLPLQPSGVSRKAMVILGAVLGLLAGIALAGLLAVVRLLRTASRSAALRPAILPHPAAVVVAPAAVSVPAAVAAAEAVVPEPADRTPPALAEEIRPSVAAEASELRRAMEPEATPVESLAGPASSADAPAPAEPAAVEAVGASSEHAPDRQALRNRIRTLADAYSPRPHAHAQTAIAQRDDWDDPEVARLQGEIDTVKSMISDIRRRREAQVFAS